MRKIAVCILTALLVTSLTACQNGNESSTASESVSQAVEQQASEDKNASEVKPAASNTSSGAIDTILSGFSAKAFISGEVSQDAIETILQCGAKAPSARNLQPWHFTVIRDSEIAGGLVRDYPEGGVVIVVSGTTEEMEGVDVSFDCALATQNMYIAAQSLGLGAHIYMGGVSSTNESMKDTLGIPEGYEAKIFMLVAQMDDGVDAVTSASGRNPLSELVNYVDQ